MLSRLLGRTTNFRLITTLISSNISPQTSLLHASSLSSQPLYISNFDSIVSTSRFYSSNRNNNGDDSAKTPSIPGAWKLTPDNDEESNSIFGEDGDGDFAGFANEDGKFDDKSVQPSIGRSSVDVEAWGTVSSTSGDVDVFGDIEKELESTKSGGDDEWKTAEGYQPWSFDEEKKTEVFDIGEGIEGLIDENEIVTETSEAEQQLEQERQELSVKLKGPNRAFGDLIAASGITDEMLDSLIVLKDLEGVEGLPPLHVIEDIRLDKNVNKVTNAEMERKKQEEIAKSRVRKVDDKGRAYGTGRRKCSVARVFLQPGDGKFLVNDKQFDVYFPILDQRADLLRPFSETKTLGLWDVNCTVKGGGVSGQVGAIRLGLSRALQNWEPGLHGDLKAVGFLTRDPRMVERKKPGKAKARKSFQWVKR